MHKIDRLELEKMVHESNAEDCTESIRSKKHSTPLRESVQRMISLKKKNKVLSRKNPEEFDRLLTEQCSFLFNNYTDIFNRIKKDELDLNILHKFIDILEKIENNELNQYDGSHEVGKMLKAIYIDSAIKKVNKIDQQKKYIEDKESIPTSKNISWQQYKKTHLNKK